MTLATLYRQVPRIACQGKCADSCGPIVVGTREAHAMRQAAGGQPLTVDTALTCGYLREHRCTVYAVRPLICRLWGVVPEMPCPWGCTVERLVPPFEALVLLGTLRRIAGRPVVSRERRPVDVKDTP